MDIGFGIGIVVVLLVVFVSWPSTTKPVDLGPAKPQARPVAQQSEYEYLSGIGVIDGTPGRLTTSMVLDRIDEVENGNYTRQQKYDLLDTLDFAVDNNHAYGVAASVKGEISAAIQRVQGLR